MANLTKAQIQYFVLAAKAIPNDDQRKLFVRLLLPALYATGGKKFNAIQFCIDCNVPTLL